MLLQNAVAYVFLPEPGLVGGGLLTYCGHGSFMLQAVLQLKWMVL